MGRGDVRYDGFAADYAEAREKFRDACSAQGGRLWEVPHPLAGPRGEALAMDVARFGDPKAPALLAIGSGTHGVEGFCGSGIQVGELHAGLPGRLPAGVGLVMIHAINPFGFAWVRRVNEDNVDVNRNFRDFDVPCPPNPGYEALYDALNPPALGPEQEAATLAAVAAYQEEHGGTALYCAVSGGQYTHPSGLQFGGRAPVWSNRALRGVWAEAFEGADVLVNVDLHSGLGESGTGLLMQTAADDDPGSELAVRWWGPVLRTPPVRGGTDALLAGVLGPALSEARPGRTTVAVVLEFGTYPNLPVALAMQADNWLHQHGQLESDEGRAIKARLREMFYPDSEAWRRRVCERAREVIDQALAGLTVSRTAAQGGAR